MKSWAYCPLKRVRRGAVRREEFSDAWVARMRKETEKSSRKVPYCPESWRDWDWPLPKAAPMFPGTPVLGAAVKSAEAWLTVMGVKLLDQEPFWLKVASRSRPMSSRKLRWTR